MLKIKIQEIGRSMVEMLGVLAIIGILSIGGVAGYRYAMDRHIANDVLHESNIRGFDVSANFKGRRLPDISEIGGYAKFTGTGKPISVYPNPSDFVWSEYSDKCRSEELCQAFDVEVRGLNKRQCSIIMQSGWDLPDAIMVYKGAASGEGGNIGGEDTAPIAMVSATKPIVRTASSLDSSLCDDFGEEETDIAIRFRFVSTFMDFADEDTETGWEDEGNSDETDDTGGGSSGGSSGGTTEGGSGETGGGEGEGGSGTVPDDDEPVECSGGKEDNGFGICECPTGTTDIGGICKTNCKGGKEFNSAGVCECPGGTTDVKGICRTNCTGNFAFDGEGNCTVCIKNWYGDDCNTFCTATWSNGECLCVGDAYWGGDSCIDCGTNQQVNETKTGCECKSNWYGNDCSVYCDESVATMDGGVCICTDNSKYWNGQSCLSCGTNKIWKNGACACDDTSYPDGEQCIQCPSGTTPTANGCKCDGDNEYWTGDFCLTCDSNATFDAENNECICNTGYYGSGTSCSECKKPRITNETNTECVCPNGTNWTGEDTNRCEEPDDGSGGVTDMCDSGLVWDSVNGECVSSSCSSSTTCPHGYVCDITDGRCIRNWNCSNPNALDVSQGKCLDCENRVWTEAGKCTACPSNQTRINGICNCPDSQLFHDATCVDFCPTSAPFVDVRNCVIECPNDKPAPDVNNVCQPCPDGTGWNAETNACELLINDTCVQGMLDAGFDESEFTVVGSEIRVDGDLKLENSLYVPECKLVVNGDLIICKETPDPLWSDVSAGSIKPGELCCPEGQIEQDGECVADIGLTCVTAMTEAGISADKLTREGATIKYASDMVIANDLDISACDLEVAGTLTINSEITFRVNNITAETSEENGIYVDTNASFFAQGNITGIGLRGINNNGTMECVNMSAIGNGGIQYTTLLNKGVIRATGDVSGSGSTAVGINNQNTLEAKNVTGSTTSNASNGIVNTGVLTVKEIAVGTGHQTGIDNSGTLNAQQVKGIGQATEFAGGVAIINRGQIVAETVIADRQYEANNPMIDENVAALTNESNGVITAYNVYYCRFISNLGEIIGAISCNCTDSTQCSGTTPTACTAPTPVLLGNLTTCVSCKTADSTKPYWNGFACVATCSGDKPVADDTNNICITCAEADDSKPYPDGTQCVAECPADKPIVNNGVCSTECSEDKPLINDCFCVTECPTGTTEVSGLCLSDEATVCATEMINAGFNTSDFMMNGMTIKYKDDLVISSSLDISTCNLDVAGTVTVDLDVILKVNNLTAESNDYIGIYNNGGVIEATTATGKSNTEYSGIYNSGILSISGDVIGTSLDDIGVYNEGTMDVEGDIEGISITYIGIENNEGIINAANVIGTSGEDNGISNSGTITTTGDVIGTSEEADFDGVNNDTTGVIVATNIYYCQTINNDGQIIGKVSCNCVDSTQCVGAEPLVCQMPTPVLSGDLSTCLSCTDADFGMPYWDGNSCVDECPADKPVADDGVCVVNCPENKPFIDEGVCLAVCPADKPFSNDGVCVATCPENTTSIDNMCLSETAQSCYTAMSLAEFSIDNFTMQGVTIKYTGDMVIQNSLDISGCNLEVAGTLDVNSGKTLTVNNVKAESISEYGINNYGTIEANSVSGTSESKAGINNYGTI
ncbi:MAG: hypothetical protein IKZ02_02975, partial [Alphaproteobacteria bacterium]|nr:hypothetical protein [Alphaproteobacteria bacterium]